MREDAVYACVEKYDYELRNDLATAIDTIIISFTIRVTLRNKVSGVWSSWEIRNLDRDASELRMMESSVYFERRINGF